MTLLPAFLLSLILSAPGAPEPDVAVVCPASFEPALAPWVEFRQQQGHRIVFLRAEQTPAAIRAGLQKLAKNDALRFVLLVGDADPAMHTLPAIRARCVPPHYVAAKINVKWGSESHLSTDNWYADLDGDDLPELAIGRLTADTPEELSLMVQKILAYEQKANFGGWRRKVNFVAGVGGFGKLADAVLESSTRTLIAGGLPAAYESSMTYASWQSPYCPHPQSFHEATVARLNEGCLFWVYIGHGHYRTLDQMRGPEGTHRILTAEDVDHLRCESGNPIAFFMACYTGAYDAADDCIAEEMLRTPGGPVAIFSGSRVTMPYAMAVMGTELIGQVFVQHASTLGEAILHAKRAMLTEPDAANKPAATEAKSPAREKNEKAGITRRSLDLLAATISPAPEELATERREHVQMFNLFGDPLLGLHHGSRLSVEVPADIAAGESLEVTGDAPWAGRCVVELVATRGLLTHSPPARTLYDATPEGVRQQNADYERANDRRWASQETQIQPGPFHFSVPVPLQAAGSGHVCVFIEGAESFAMGSADLTIRRVTPAKKTAALSSRSIIPAQIQARSASE
jgi:hypothetical protein